MRTDLDRLRDAHDHGSHALGMMNELAFDQSSLHRDRFQSLLFDIAVIGTTLGKVSETILRLERNVPWRSVINTPNRVVHAYWQIDMAVLPNVVTVADVEQLVAALTRLIIVVERAEP